VFTAGRITVITAATGHPSLGRCLASVQEQTWGDVEHWVVIDGREREEAVRGAIATVRARPKSLEVMVLPFATGKENWNGHRIYGATPFLCNSEFVAYLDEDNWFEPDHLETLMTEIASRRARWGFALRTIRGPTGRLICDDNCESLGPLHPVFNNSHDFLIDTSCYLLSCDVAVQFSFSWYRRTGSPGVLSADRTLCRMLMEHGPASATNRRHTVNYSIGNRPESVSADFFLEGNRAMKARYPRGMPWECPEEG
jgi:Glycosyl transferase family 2